MAIIQSIVMGKSTGKIGNVVTTVLKGQTIAKSLNSSPANPKTAAQTVSRIKMANAVKAYQFLATFLIMATALRKPLESVYNAFVRLTKTLCDGTTVAATLSDAAVGLTGNAIGSTDYGYESYSSKTATAISLNIETGGISWDSNKRIRIFAWIASAGHGTLVDRAITEAEWTSGDITITDLIASFNTFAVYHYDSSSMKLGQILIDNAA